VTMSRKESAKEPRAKARNTERREKQGTALTRPTGAIRKRGEELQRQSAEIARKLQIALEAGLPEIESRTIGAVVADIDSLWDTGQKLDKELKRLFRMKFPRDRERLREFFSFIEAIQVEMGTFWIGNLKRRVPTLRKALRDQAKYARKE
jgi:hypothetical protein